MRTRGAMTHGREAPQLAAADEAVEVERVKAVDVAGSQSVPVDDGRILRALPSMARIAAVPAQTSSAFVVPRLNGGSMIALTRARPVAALSPGGAAAARTCHGGHYAHTSLD